jgi:hypothetical protein
MLFFKPFGGSLVILMPACNTAVGKSFEGYDVSHNLNSELVNFGSGDSSSHNFSKVVIHVTAKWQFYNTIQSPVF